MMFSRSSKAIFLRELPRPGKRYLVIDAVSPTRWDARSGTTCCEPVRRGYSASVRPEHRTRRTGFEIEGTGGVII